MNEHKALGSGPAHSGPSIVSAVIRITPRARQDLVPRVGAWFLLMDEPVSSDTGNRLYESQRC